MGDDEFSAVTTKPSLVFGQSKKASEGGNHGNKPTY